MKKKRIKKPMFSFVMPVKNAERTIDEALGSLENQTNKDFEIIVSDDGSDDRSMEIAKNHDCTIVDSDKWMGASFARNKGAAKAKGEYIVFVDSDIVLNNDVLEKAKKFIGNNPETKVFFGTFVTKNRFKNFFSQYKHLYLCYYYLKQDEYVHTLDTSMAFIERKLFEKYKFNNEVKISEDVELSMRIVKDGHKIKINRELLMEHIRYYSMRSFVKADFMRGLRFSRLLLKSLFKDRKESKNKTFYLKPINIYLNVGFMPFLLLSILFYILFPNFYTFLPMYSIILILVSFNLEYWFFLRKIKGNWFFIQSIFATFFDAIVMDVGITITFLRFLMHGHTILE